MSYTSRNLVHDSACACKSVNKVVVIRVIYIVPSRYRFEQIKEPSKRFKGHSTHVTYLLYPVVLPLYPRSSDWDSKREDNSSYCSLYHTPPTWF